LAKLTEIRWHGRAGQGIVTASELLAEAALKENKYFQAFPEYGPERMGAPIKAYTRVSDEPIEIHYQILNPEVVVVVNPNLLGVVDVLEGISPNGVLVVNTTETPAQIRQRLKIKNDQVKVFAVDATKIALETIRRDIPATLMLGAVIRATGLVDLKHTLELVQEKLGAKLRAEIVESNKTALRRAYEEVQEG
jgi:pyruvate ferredoxin oxidoreductase gamma subunit